MRALTLFTVLMVLVIFTPGCKADRTVNGYSVVAPHDELFGVVHDSTIVLGPRVTKWCKHKQWLLGYKVAQIGNYDDLPFASSNGYFAIDTSAGNPDIQFEENYDDFIKLASRNGIMLTDINLEDLP